MSAQALLVLQPGVPAMSDAHGSLGWSSVAMLRDGDELILFDTGGPGYRALWDDWLAELGAARGDVTTVALTHSHWDHVGAATWFPNARYLLGADELLWVERGTTSPYVDGTTIEALRRSGRLEVCSDGDVFGGVRVLGTPGHTPGHLSFVIEAPGAGRGLGRYVFAGDALKDLAEAESGRFAITEDAGLSEESRQRILAQERDGAIVLFGHSAPRSQTADREVLVAIRDGIAITAVTP